MEILPDRCVPIAKKELMYMGTVGLACWLGGIIFINRKKTDDAISVMTEAADTMLREDVSFTTGGCNGEAREITWRQVGDERKGYLNEGLFS